MNPITSRPSASPRYAPLPEFCLITGLGRTKAYALAAQGKLRFVKVGSRTLGDVESALQYLDTLPAAEITFRRKAKGA